MKISEKIVLSVLLIPLFLIAILAYIFYAQEKIYEVSTTSMMETYEQVNNSFGLFAERNWNVLTEWGRHLSELETEQEVRVELQRYAEEKRTWNYSSMYLFNENATVYWVMEQVAGSGEKLEEPFGELYRTGKPIVTSYRLSDGTRKVAFVVPVDPIVLDGTAYTCLAVSYNNTTLEEMIGGHAYGGRSDCYIIYPDGRILLTEKPKSEIAESMENLLDFISENIEVLDAERFEQMKQNVGQGGRGSLSYRYLGKVYYLVYQPMSFQGLSLVGTVERDIVEHGMRQIQRVTILMLVPLALVVLGALLRTIRVDYAKMLEEREKALKKEESERRKLERLANTDGLTGLYNERCFDRTLAEQCSQGIPFALFFLDLDRFKPVNDNYGHDAGDCLLRAVALRLRSCVRNVDDVFRLGGDEFALIVYGDVSGEFCQYRAERIKRALSEPFELEGQNVTIGASCGAARFPQECADGREARILADRRMYEDKRNGREDAPEELR